MKMRGQAAACASFSALSEQLLQLCNFLLHGRLPAPVLQQAECIRIALAPGDVDGLGPETDVAQPLGRRERVSERREGLHHTNREMTTCEQQEHAVNKRICTSIL